MNKKKKKLKENEVFTKKDFDRMSDELMFRALGTRTLSAPLVMNFLEEVIENPEAMRRFIKLALKITEEEYLLATLDENAPKN
ncbi:MAG: hypothetical protein ACP5JP_06680 [bacterium]